MSRKDRVVMMQNIRDSIEGLAAKIFEEVDQEIEKHTQEFEGRKLVESSKLRWSLRATRLETLRAINKIGRGYESEQ